MNVTISFAEAEKEQDCAPIEMVYRGERGEIYGSVAVIMQW